jgi:branched-chain amino acid aminotransferase
MAQAPFNDRDGVIWFNGKLVPWREANIHILTHAMHYAGAVFEGERGYNGKIFKSREHSERLLRSAEIIGYKIPYTAEQIDKAKAETMAANNLKDCYVRPIAWRGSEMMGVSAQQAKINVAVATWEWPAYFSPELREKGIKLCWAKWARPAPNTAPTASKASGLYMICTASKHAAEDAGYHDALMLDYRGQIAEATGANVFLVIDGEIHTPKPDCFLDGITRRTVIDLARQRQYKVHERAIMPDELGKAQEVFLTGSAAEVTAVGSIDKYNFTVGPVTRNLRDDYAKLVRQ